MCTAAADKHTIILYEGLSELVLFRFESSENCVILVGSATGLIKVDRQRSRRPCASPAEAPSSPAEDRTRQDKTREGTIQQCGICESYTGKGKFSQFFAPSADNQPAIQFHPSFAPSPPIRGWLDVSSAHIGVVQHMVLRQNDTRVSSPPRRSAPPRSFCITEGGNLASFM